MRMLSLLNLFRLLILTAYNKRDKRDKEMTERPWEVLDLSKAAQIKREVDAVVAQFELFSGNEENSSVFSLVQSIQSRISELEVFYAQNCDGSESSGSGGT